MDAATGESTRSVVRSGTTRVWWFICAVGLVAAGLWTVVLLRLGAPGGLLIPWWVLAIAFYLAETFVAHLHFRKQAHTLSASEVGLVLGLFFATPAALLTAQMVGAGLALAVHRRQRPIKFAFNMAEIPLCTALAVLIFRSLYVPGHVGGAAWVLALVAAIAAHVAGVLLVSSVIAVAEGRFSAPQLPRTLVTSLVGVAATTCLGLLAVELINSDPRATLLLVLPLVACGLAFRGYMRQREHREHLEFLYESMRATQGAPEFGLAVGELLVAARRLLRADYAEILLSSPIPGEPVHRSVSGSSGQTLMVSEALTPVDADALERTGAADRPALLPRRRGPNPLDDFLSARGLEDAVVGALRGEERVFGLLVVGGRVSDVSTFSEEDLSLFETFGGHAAVLLENGRLERSLAQVTELKEELSHRAHYDTLTALPNRLLFSEMVATALAGGGPDTTHALLYIDLDRFKLVNDSWGHAAGDDLLVQVAERIRIAVRPGDTPARLGGDEFAVLLPNTDTEGAERTAQRLADAIDAPFLLSSGHQATVHASIGIAVADAVELTADDLLRNADIAMYTAKSSEHRSVLYLPAFHDRLRRRRELALEVERGIERDEFIVHFQPVVSLVDGAIQAFEALARWQHPARGLLRPDEFLGVAEETGLISAIGARVREQAFACASSWAALLPEQADLGLWVNIAPDELTSERLVEELALALTRTHLDARRLTVEITESSVIRDEPGALEAMRRLRELGIRLSIDDFGTGYSSLARLAEFPIEMVKIPKPFVDRLVGESASTTIVDAILRMAGSLGLITVSEGIEYPEQARMLRNLGCGLGQGYLYSRPIGANDTYRLLRSMANETGSAVLPVARSLAN
ncbi:MAG TPA: EAL domain-containing protein [Actinomycetota bacterium]